MRTVLDGSGEAVVINMNVLPYFPDYKMRFFSCHDGCRLILWCNLYADKFISMPLNLLTDSCIPVGCIDGSELGHCGGWGIWPVQRRRVHNNRATVLVGSYAVTRIRQWGLKTRLFLHAGWVGEDWAVWVLTTLENLENVVISRNLLILENSGNLKFTQGIYQMLFFCDAICLSGIELCA